MPDSIKDKIKADLQKVKEEGTLRSGRIKKIFSAAISQSISEFKEGSGELGYIIRDTFATLLENVKEKGQNTKEEVTASIEGMIEGISHSQREAIAKTKSEIQKLQTRLDEDENQLQSTVEEALTEIEAVSEKTSSDVRSIVSTAVENIKNSEEVELMKKRYAQLQAELSVLQANLAARYGEPYEEVKQHLDNAKTWYENTKEKSEKKGSTLVQAKQTEFENKMSEAGAAVARKEKELKRILKELWYSLTHSQKS